MTTEEDFQRQLDANPDDHHTRMVFADWLQEHNDPRAEGYRALGIRNLYPGESFTNYDHWHWGRDDSESVRNGNIQRFLPSDWHELINGNKSSSLNWKLHNTRQEAEDAAALAFAQLPQERRAELLGQQSAEKLTRRRLARRRYK